MYGIYGNIGCILMVNVTIYTIHGSYGKWHVECGEKPSNHWHQLCGVTTTSLIWSLMKEPLEDHHHFVVADFMPCIWIIHCKRAPYENISCDIPTPIEGEGGGTKPSCRIPFFFAWKPWDSDPTPRSLGHWLENTSELSASMITAAQFFGGMPSLHMCCFSLTCA